MSELKLHIKLLNDLAYMPERSTEQATGYDLRCTEDFSVPAFTAVLVPLGFAMQVVNNGALIDAQIRPRSSVSLKGINTPIGTIDLDYRGEVKVCLQNITPKVIDFNKGDKIAQMVFLTYDTPIVQLKTELTTTERGEGGFGSTGR
jgi:dUTP pyrophosphatase